MKTILLIILASLFCLSVVGCAAGMDRLNTDTYTKTYKNGHIRSIAFKDGPKTLLMFDHGKLVSVSKDALLAGTFKAWLRNVFYYKNGKLHKKDGPAYEVSIFTFISNDDGTTSDVVIIREYRWYKKGLLDRKDGPAIEKTNGYKAWYRKGVLDRKDGPAVITEKGNKLYYKNDLLHRLDGPAVIWKNPDGRIDEEWWINGVEYSKEEFEVIVVDMQSESRHSGKFRFSISIGM